MNKHEQRAREWLKANCFAPIPSMCVKSLAAEFAAIDTEARQQQREEWHAIYHALCRLERTPEGDDNWLDAYSNLWGEFSALREKWRAAAIREGGR